MSFLSVLFPFLYSVMVRIRIRRSNATELPSLDFNYLSISSGVTIYIVRVRATPKDPQPQRTSINLLWFRDRPENYLKNKVLIHKKMHGNRLSKPGFIRFHFKCRSFQIDFNYLSGTIVWKLSFTPVSLIFLFLQTQSLKYLSELRGSERRPLAKIS